jgi:hypothetical protein
MKTFTLKNGASYARKRSDKRIYSHCVYRATYGGDFMLIFFFDYNGLEKNIELGAKL